MNIFTNLAEHLVVEHLLKLGNKIVTTNVAQFLNEKYLQVVCKRSA